MTLFRINDGNDFRSFQWKSGLTLLSGLKYGIILPDRIRQHNGEIAGGAKASRSGRPWKIICTVKGFPTYSEGNGTLKSKSQLSS